jgi:hypothetical protein
MPKTTTYKLSIKSANEIGFTLQSVVAEPRQCNPLDLQAACANLSLVAEGEEPPKLATQLVQFLLTDFFALAHRTGLYNRQKKLWEALSRLIEVKISRLNYGIFGKTDLPILEFLFTDGLGKVLVLARLFEPSQTDAFNLENEKDCKNLLQSAVQRSEKLRSENPAFAGLFLCWPSPIATSVVKTVEQLTGASDPIARYESLLPGPFGVCIDLLEFSHSEFSLVHPKLPDRIKTGRQAANSSAELAEQN